MSSSPAATGEQLAIDMLAAEGAKLQSIGAGADGSVNSVLSSELLRCIQTAVALVSSCLVVGPGHGTAVCCRFWDEYDLTVPRSEFKYKICSEFLVNTVVMGMKDMMNLSTARTELDVAKAEIARLQGQLTAAGRLHGDLRTQLAQAAARVTALQQQKEAVEHKVQQKAAQVSCACICPATFHKVVQLQSASDNNRGAPVCCRAAGHGSAQR